MATLGKRHSASGINSQYNNVTILTKEAVDLVRTPFSGSSCK